MPVNSDFNFDDILSLDKAKLVNRVRLNFLGSQEMVLRYNNVGSAMREDAVEYLEQTAGYGVAGAMISPTFGFKTYEGSWFSIDITYNEDKQFITQRFKKDKGLEDVTAQKTKNGVTALRSYFWKVVDPDSVVITAAIPEPVPAGDVYSKNVADNGDGTYDVTIIKETIADLQASSEVQAGLGEGTGFPGGYREESDVSTSTSQLAFGAVPDAGIGEIKSIDNVPLENGKFRVTITTRTATPQRVPPDSQEGGPDWPWLEYGSDYLTSGNSIIVGRNRTWDEFLTDRDRTKVSPAIFKINSISVRVNDYGLYDYTITSNAPG
jgi:hypothetical protein